MCSACGFPARPGHWTDAGLATPQDRLRARFRRAAILRTVLRGQGLTAHDDGATGLLLSTLGGAHVLVEDADRLWDEVARASGRPFDPLDPDFLGPPA